MVPHAGHGRSLFLLALALAAIAAATLCAGAPVARAALGPRQIDAFLLEQGSPLAGEGRTFYLAGERNGVDPAFLVAIAGAESSFGRFLFSTGPQTASHNAFNWFYAPTRVGSAFAGWDQAIATVAAGLRGPLYYGAGRYSVAAIAPVYCPQGTQDWVTNVTMYMLELGADPGDTRWQGAAIDAGTSASADLGTTLSKAGGAILVVRRPVVVLPRRVTAGARLRIRFTLTDAGLASGVWQAVVLRLEGPGGRELAFGTRRPLRLDPGASYAFVATLRLPLAGRWRGWVDVQTQAGAIDSGAGPVLRFVAAAGRSGRAARSDQR
jgi:hypothetical protein